MLQRQPAECRRRSKKKCLTHAMEEVKESKKMLSNREDQVLSYGSCKKREEEEEDENFLCIRISDEGTAQLNAFRVVVWIHGLALYWYGWVYLFCFIFRFFFF